MKQYNKLHLTQTVTDMKQRKRLKAIQRDESINARCTLIEKQSKTIIKQIVTPHLYVITKQGEFLRFTY